MFRRSRNMAVLLNYGLRSNKRKVIETCDAPTVSTIHRRDGRVGAITLVRVACPDCLVHSVEHLRTIHQREGGHIGQVDIDQFSVVCLNLGGIGQSGDLFDQCIRGRILVAAPVAVLVVLGLGVGRVHQLVGATPRHGRASAACRRHHEDVIAGGQRPVDVDGLINGPFRVVGGDVDADLLTGGGNHFNGRPASRTSHSGRWLRSEGSCLCIDASHRDLCNTGVIQQFIGAFDVVASPLQSLDGRITAVIQGLFAGGRVHQGARNLFEGGRLVGHGVGDDRVIVNRHGDGLADRNLVQTIGCQVEPGGREVAHQCHKEHREGRWRWAAHS